MDVSRMLSRRQCCPEGTANQLFEFLRKPLSDNELRSCPPLMVAAKNGFSKTVLHLLESDPKPNLEEESTIQIRGQNDIEGVTALWCAAGAGHFESVKLLVEAGANVNHATKSNSTPLHVACYSGVLRTVEFLIQRGADIQVQENHGHSCLMAATYRGYLDVLLFLLDKGTDSNQRTVCGNTALHIAAECGNVNVMVLFLQFGAKPRRNAIGLSPLHLATKCSLAHMVEYLVTRPEFCKEDKVGAMELLGASFANNPDFYNLPSAYKYMRLSMELRFSDPEAPLPKVLGEPVAAYGNWVECQSLEELERIQHDAAALHMESLAVRERILGQRHPEVADAVEFRGSVFAEEGRYDRTAELWLHALRIRQQNKMSVLADVMRFVKLFTRMWSGDIDLRFSVVYGVFSACLQEIQTWKEALTDSRFSRHVDYYQDEYQRNIIAIVKLLLVISRLLHRFSSNEKFTMRQHIFRLNQAEIRMRDRQTLLHAVCGSEDAFAVEDEPGLTVPCIPAIRLLIECGASLNSRDIRGNTPLHVIATHRNGSVASEVIFLLLGAGAHVDCVNVFGNAPIDIAYTDAALQIFQSQIPLTLRCIAAKAVMDYNIQFENQIPKTLIDFVYWHGIRNKRS